MKHYALLLFLTLPAIGVSAPSMENNSYWVCTTKDKTDKQWSIQNYYQKVALNMAFAACKKESQSPASCKSSVADCEGFVQGVSTRPMWQCTALDRTAADWRSNFYSQPEDAALAAKAYCKENSTIPDTCYINMVTCRNLNEGAGL